MKKVPTGISPIITLDRNSTKTLQTQIYDGYRSAIVDQRLRCGQRVPSSRVLAAELGVSRIPVLNAYAQLLAEGYFEARIGSGTSVAHFLPEQFAVAPARRIGTTTLHPGNRSVSQRAKLLRDETVDPWLRQTGALGVGQIAFDAFPQQVWSRLVVRHARNLSPAALHYGEVMGNISLRGAIAEYLATSRAVRCDPQQIMIVSGSQQALEISARALLDDQQKIWMEEPGYPLARQVFAGAGCQIVPVPVDREGLDVAAGIKRAPKARAAFVTPSHQYPLGATMTAARRFQLLNWAQQAGAWILEDDYDSEYRYESRPVASLQGLDSNSRVIYIGTFSKVLFPALRLGYMVIPSDLVEPFRVVRRAMDIGPSSLLQSVLADFISEGHFSRHIRRMRVLYSERRNALIEGLRKEFGPSCEVLGADAGMHVVIVPARQRADHEISHDAAARGFWLWPLSPCYFSEPARQGFILGFGSTPVEQIPAAVKRLRTFLSDNRK